MSTFAEELFCRGMENPLLSSTPRNARSFVAIAGHPLHPMLVAFPIAYLVGALACDAAYWWTGDVFWAKVSIWVLGAGFVMGGIAALAGTLDFMIVREIRHHVTSWSHFLAAVMMLSLTGANWWLRVGDPAGGVMPWGIYLSAITVLALTVAGWLGGKLVFEHKVGVAEDEF